MNEIARQFHDRPPDLAAAAVADHVERFWDPRMRADLKRHVAEAPESLDPVALAAAGLVDRETHRNVHNGRS
ncbi:formate dehydrogenase subunit delta [Actinosynnema sp. NPDC059335]|uniref:formate dehydrogenase subunit delta n=1 Tax=Actinosynnema sp. NPDC059335 TaxID=3346804 RepID=UPI0036710628